MATNMAAPPRPLNNSELVWESTYLQLCNLYASGKRNEALDLAWECYQDPVIPRILRTTCCIILGTADGDYLMFAQEGVESAKSMLNAHPDNLRLQAILKEAQEVLDLAEQDSEADHKQAVADVDSADAEAAAAAAAASADSVFPARTEQLEVDNDLLDSQYSEQLKGNWETSSMVSESGYQTKDSEETDTERKG